MGRRTTGLGFCAIAAFLFASRYVVAAIYGSGTNSWSAELFNSMLRYSGSALLVLSIISLIVGIVYLVWAEVKR